MSRVELFERIRREHRDEGVGIRALAERPWGTEMRSCSSSVLVQETAEQVASVDRGSRLAAEKRHRNGWIRRLKVQRPVGTVGVVVRDVPLEGLLEVASPDEQQPVQALDPHRLDPAFRVGVGVGLSG